MKESNHCPMENRSIQTVEDEINLLDLWHVFLREKRVFFLVFIVTSTMATALAFTLSPVYRAEVVLEPISEEGQLGGDSLGEYGGLASLAGIQIHKSDSKETHIATLKSRAFIEKFITDEHLLPLLFLGQGRPKTGTMWEGVELFTHEILKVTTDKKTGLILLAVEWQDREKACLWANLLVERLDGHLRNVAIQDAKKMMERIQKLREKIDANATQKGMEYFNSEFTKPHILELQQALTLLFKSKIRKIILAEVQPEFAFKVIDPAIVPPENVYIRPKRRLMVVLGCVLGGFLGLFAAFFRNAWRRGRVAASDAHSHGSSR